MTTREIIGKPVISMADGEKVGDVSDLLIDTVALSATILVIHGDKESYNLPWVNVKGLGTNAITIEDKSALAKNDKPVEPLREFKEFAGTNVIDGTGTIVGAVHELILDETGHIRTIETRAGGVFGIGAKGASIDAQEVRGVGPRLVTIERLPPATT